MGMSDERNGKPLILPRTGTRARVPKTSATSKGALSAAVSMPGTPLCVALNLSFFMLSTRSTPRARPSVELDTRLAKALEKATEESVARIGRLASHGPTYARLAQIHVEFQDRAHPAARTRHHSWRMVSDGVGEQ